MQLLSAWKVWSQLSGILITWLQQLLHWFIRKCGGSQNKSVGCSTCPAETYAKNSGSTKCQQLVACSQGKYITFAGNASHDRQCNNCSRGEYTNVPNEDSCTICTTNTFQNINGQNACKNCPIGKYKVSWASS